MFNRGLSAFRIYAKKLLLIRVMTSYVGRYTSGGAGRSVDVFVDGGVVLAIDDDTMMVVTDHSHGHGRADRR